MTWYYKDDGNRTLEIYDHTGALVSTASYDGESETEFKDTNSNVIHTSRSSGYQVPDDILAVMEHFFEKERNNSGNTPFGTKAGNILRDAVFENIEEGTPP